SWSVRGCFLPSITTRTDDPVGLIPTILPVRLLNFRQRFIPNSDSRNLEPTFKPEYGGSFIAEKIEVAASQSGACRYLDIHAGLYRVRIGADLMGGSNQLPGLSFGKVRQENIERGRD